MQRFLWRLFTSLRGRTSRAWFWFGLLVCGVLFALGVSALHGLFGLRATAVLYPLLYWALVALALKRAHDLGYGGGFLLWLLVPIVGQARVVLELGLRRGTAGENRFGPDPRTQGLDYAQVERRPGQPDQLVDDVTRLNPIGVAAVVRPRTVAEVQQALERSRGPVSIGGGRFSMGGQTASPGSLHLDMRSLNRIVRLEPEARRVRVQGGARWCDLQAALDPFDLSISIMQTYANFTVGGSLSVNAHGRYVGRGPLILSVESIQLALADGALVRCSRSERPELFFGAIGGYGALGVIVEAELRLEENHRVERTWARVPREAYREHFAAEVASRPEAVFHNADLYPPHYRRARSVTWVRTERPVTEHRRRMQLAHVHPVYRYLFWAVSESPLGKWRREHIFDPLFYSREAIHWRNFEAGYDVRELEPASRRRTTYVLQEYFIPVDRFDEFVPEMAAIFQRYRVNVVNNSIRHALPDDGSMLAWAPDEVFAFVVYYKQGVDRAAREAVAVWTREMIDAALAVGGRWYLPYQVHGRLDQLRRGYPRVDELVALKAEVDPEDRFRNTLWDRYLPALRGDSEAPPAEQGLFRTVLSDDLWRDRLYLFFQNVFRLADENAAFTLVREATEELAEDEDIYRYIQRHQGRIKGPLADLQYGVPALRKQQRVLVEQTLTLLGSRRSINGYLEMGTTGRYVAVLRRDIKLTGPIWLMHDVAPSWSPVDMLERRALAPFGQHIPLADYAPIPDTVATGSLDLATCYIGLHHILDPGLPPFLESLARVLRPGGRFILRDHDVRDEAMFRFVSLIHTVFNAGTAEPWSVNEGEVRLFRPVDRWIELLDEAGFDHQPAPDGSPGLLQAHDPSDNLLMCFVRRSS